MWYLILLSGLILMFIGLYLKAKEEDKEISLKENEPLKETINEERLDEFKKELVSEILKDVNTLITINK